MKTFVAVLRGADHIFEFVNDAHKEAFGERGLIGKARADMFPELNDQGFAAAPRRAFDTGRTVYMQGKPAEFDVMPDGLRRSRRLDISYEPMRDGRGEVTGLYVHGRDVTTIGDHPLEARATSAGLDALSDTELLTLHLYHGTLDTDAGERAEHLLSRFGSLRGVLSASIPSLMQMAPEHLRSTSRSLSASTALNLKIVREIGRRVLFRRIASRPVLASSRTLRAYLHGILAGEPREKFMVLFLDKSLRLIACETLAEGSVSHTQIYTREVLRRAIELSASAMILVHNHPTGRGTFSTADLMTTDAIVSGAEAVDIEVVDHLLVAGEEVVSLVETRGGLTRRRRAH